MLSFVLFIVSHVTMCCDLLDTVIVYAQMKRLDM